VIVLIFSSIILGIERLISRLLHEWSDAHERKTVGVGNSSVVILQKSWLDNDVGVELVKKSHDIMLCEVIGILGRRMISNIDGICLVGSYSRDEGDSGSNIDILVITGVVELGIIMIQKA